MKRKKLETIVEDLFYQITTGFRYDVEYQERQIELDKNLEKLAGAKGIDSQFESFLKDLLENLEGMTYSYMVRDVKQDKLMIEIANAIDERELRAIRIACRAGILCGISLSKDGEKVCNCKEEIA